MTTSVTRQTQRLAGYRFAPARGILVLNDVRPPWWRAELDGWLADILKANVLFRAVAVAPGLHHLHFAFEPFRCRLRRALEKATAVW
jgi:hypothetical protein